MGLEDWKTLNVKMYTREQNPWEKGTQPFSMPNTRGVPLASMVVRTLTVAVEAVGATSLGPGKGRESVPVFAVALDMSAERSTCVSSSGSCTSDTAEYGTSIRVKHCIGLLASNGASVNHGEESVKACMTYEVNMSKSALVSNVRLKGRPGVG